MSGLGFDFVPRKLAKSGKAPEKRLKPYAPSIFQSEAQAEHAEPSSSLPVEKRGEKEKEKYLDDGAYASLFALALSDYALWSNTELFEAVEENEEGCEYFS